MHVNTGWKFKQMITFRDQLAQKLGLDLIVHQNKEGVDAGINPFDHGSSKFTDIMKTQERVYSFRDSKHRWDPKNQRPELWNIYNGKVNKGESIRVFPLSNWTELDIWQYIYLEQIPLVPLYFAEKRPVVERNGTLIMVDDDRMPLREGEVPEMKSVRFRTLGDYPLTGAVESEANTLPEIIQEMLLATSSERQGRMIDHDESGSMEKKKQEGYF
jgi:sulfate adenylyltransferase subunit 2